LIVATGFPNQVFGDSWVVGIGGPAMVDISLSWEEELERWLDPFLNCLGHKARRRMCPLYVGPGDRKSVQPKAARLVPGDFDQLHHFIADGVWDAAPLEAELLVQADRLVGGKDAVLVIDDTAMPKKGDRSVGVAPQYAVSLRRGPPCAVRWRVKT
jgi:SRSO17 transposase